MFVCVAQRTRAQQIVPCTVCQLMSAVQAEDVFKVGEVEIAQVSLISVIFSVNINNRSLVAFSVRVLEDMNEVTSHMLEVVNAHVQQSKPQKTMGGGGGMNVMPSMSSIGSTGSYSGAGMMLVNVSLSVNQNQVLSLIKSCHEPQGISMQDLKQKLSSMSVTVIRQIVDFLSNEGHIFSTIDEDHFRSTMKSNYLFLSDCLNKPISYLHIYILGV
uniref:Replication protein A 32 kDa subunit-like n=1 Tax=Sinocyclocheilus anshuiensis TaxID=1608454 RepID=A0A671PKA6_9TELE